MHHPKVALITGAGSGIGQACALALLQAGWQVMLCGRNAAKLQATLGKAGPLAGNADWQVTDIRDADDVGRLFEHTRTRFGRLDLLFNNAGTSAPAVALEDLSPEQWQQVLDTNLTGAFLCTQAAFRLMKAQSPMGGRIINNGSISAQVPRPNSAPYTASKHGMTGLTRATALDGRKYNIACGQIDIGNAATAMAEPMQQGIPQANGQLAVEPVMDVAHVAAAVVQMAGLPLESNVQFMTLMATQMPYIGRG
ncbi:MAG: SDR family oxidoreductase [Halopseudomonas yangmingensis]|uniref:NADP-dependent 3-hydroxy acid dehydrogenase YdfG n=1 Tax=Halopseudomonas yangmingensis TaxID=1720063 RepID=A0A1I4NNC0_9GAMM|nr:SDR family oxidoreductase [Halopseudomonas yangmingensis]SFM16653.1 NADP-dependent 3-hydroxy acid dehydrogenase YdfG [Halopseudomonas yangmingensis]